VQRTPVQQQAWERFKRGLHNELPAEQVDNVAQAFDDYCLEKWVIVRRLDEPDFHSVDPDALMAAAKEPPTMVDESSLDRAARLIEDHDTRLRVMKLFPDFRASCL